METIKIFSPATVANVSCGFDALGLALEAIGDEMVFRKTDKKGISITKIEGAQLTHDISKNVAGVVASAMLRKHEVDFGIEIEIFKNFKPGSGLGSSAASAAGAAYAMNALLGNQYATLELTKFAMLGEEAACGSQIADNVAAALFGGFVLVRSCAPLDIVKIPVPEELSVTVLHPQIEIKTEDSRTILPQEIPLKDAVTQWANVGGLISGLYSNDYQLIARSLQDVVVEPFRKKLIPHFDQVKEKAIEAGALGAGISGSGPTIFALSKGMTTAEKVADAMSNVFRQTGIDFEVHTSKVNKQGIKLLEQN